MPDPGFLISVVAFVELENLCNKYTVRNAVQITVQMQDKQFRSRITAVVPILGQQQSNAFSLNRLTNPYHHDWTEIIELTDVGHRLSVLSS